MKLVNRISNAYQSFIGGHSVETFVKPEEPTNTADNKRKRSANDFPDKIQKFRSHEDIRTLETAITLSETGTYNREDLHKIFRQFVLEDPHVLSAWTNRKIRTLKKEFGVFKIGETTPDAAFTDLLEKPWFYSFVEAALESRAWGFSCIELYNWSAERKQFEQYRSDRTKEIFPAVNLINHDFVKPETGYIVRSPGISETGQDIYELLDQLIFVGGREQGFLFRLAKPILFKNNAIANWSEWIEVFGIDAIIVQTEAKGQDRRALLQALSKFSTSRVGTIDPDDKITTVGSNKTDAFRVFEQMGRYIDESSSKIIFGQDVISNNTGQVVGNVGENVANDYAEADARLIVSIVNNQLFPLLINNKYLDLSGYEFRYINKTSLREMTERAAVDLAVSQMGFKHDPEQINERYSVNVETVNVGNLAEIKNKLKTLYPQ